MTLQPQKLKDEVLANQLDLDNKKQIIKNLKDKIENNSSVNLKQVKLEK